MPLSLHTNKRTKGANKKRKNIGRGNSSGSGTYSGRGQKGQKSRAGVSGLKRMGMKQILLRTPKKRGFKSLKKKNIVVNLSSIDKNFEDSETVDAKSLLGKGLVSDKEASVKILGSGKLNLKGLKFCGVKISASAKEQIKKAQGEIK
ncbi:MAG: 50S ribosomal protein L15 [bacterium]